MSETPFSLVLVSGLSGAGKSSALHAFEDMGWYCVDNLPVPLLSALVEELIREGQHRIAVAIDGRSGQFEQLGEVMGKLSAYKPRVIFLDTSDDVLLVRYSETRRRHPFAGESFNIMDAITRERAMLQSIASIGQKLDTSRLTPSSLLKELQRLLNLPHVPFVFHLISFAYRQGVPRDADIVFDARCLPNPHFEPNLRPFDGRHPEIENYFRAQPLVTKFLDDVVAFIHGWLPQYTQGRRSSLTLAVGCTGGKHRSVYLVEQLGKRLAPEPAHLLVRHRGLEDVLERSVTLETR